MTENGQHKSRWSYWPAFLGGFLGAVIWNVLKWWFS